VAGQPIRTSSLEVTSAIVTRMQIRNGTSVTAMASRIGGWASVRLLEGGREPHALALCEARRRREPLERLIEALLARG
jgi:hypothetical protein